MNLHNPCASSVRQDGDIQMQLKEGHRPTANTSALREANLPRQFPGISFAFLPADSSARFEFPARGADRTSMSAAADVTAILSPQ